MNKKLKIVIGLLVIIIVVLGVLLYKKNSPSPVVGNQEEKKVAEVATPIKITNQIINEENFSGSKSVIAGVGSIADSARAYIADELDSFKQSADEEVPAMRKQFGDDAPTGKYEIFLKATYLKNSKVESIVIDHYVYTGGANGFTLYKVFNQSASNGKPLALSDIVVSEKQEQFTKLLKAKLLVWIPEGLDTSPVFPEEVQTLNFDSFTNWSMDDKNLIIYFDKYAIGPGALGAVKFPVSLSEVRDLLSI
jgi:hypothetical protein